MLLRQQTVIVVHLSEANQLRLTVVGEIGKTQKQTMLIGSAPNGKEEKGYGHGRKVQ